MERKNYDEVYSRHRDSERRDDPPRQWDDPPVWLCVTGIISAIAAYLFGADIIVFSCELDRAHGANYADFPYSSVMGFAFMMPSAAICGFICLSIICAKTKHLLYNLRKNKTYKFRNNG